MYYFKHTDHKMHSKITTMVSQRQQRDCCNHSLVINYYKATGNRMNATQSLTFMHSQTTVLTLVRGLPSKGSRECLHLQVVSKECEGSYS